MRSESTRTEGSILGSLDADGAGLRLAPHRRAAILREAKASLKQTHAARAPWLPGFAPVAAPALSWVGALAMALLVVGVGYFWAPMNVQDGSKPFAPVASASGPSNLVAYQKGDAVVLEWSNGSREAYTVRQATSARAVYDAPGVKVQGHRYVDRSPSDARIVYYLVE